METSIEETISISVSFNNISTAFKIDDNDIIQLIKSYYFFSCSKHKLKYNNYCNLFPLGNVIVIYHRNKLKKKWTGLLNYKL